MRLRFLRDEKFYHATAVLIGTMVGVGLYAIPFAFAKAGFLVGTAWLIGLALVMTLFYLMLAELVLSTQGVHQLVGYVNIWLGPWGRRIMMLANVVSIYGALLAYIIVNGDFIHNILSHFIAVDPSLYGIVFAATVSLVWFLRVKTIASIEQLMIGLYAMAVVLIVVMGAGSIRSANFTVVNAPDFWYLPYGILLFAFAGMSAVPIQRQLLKGHEELMRPAIIAALLFVAVLYLVFAAVVVGVSGDVTSPAALAGLYQFLGTPIIIVGSLLGVLTITTSFIILGTALFETFAIDYRIRGIWAWLLAVVPPILLFMSGMTNFIDVVGFVGAVAGGIIAILLLASYLRSRSMRLRVPELRMRVPWPVVLVLMAMFVSGAVIELLHR